MRNTAASHTEKTLGQLFWPIFLEMLLTMLVGICDTVMLSMVGDSAVAAAGTANSYLNVVSMILSVMSFGSLTVMTQYIGALRPGVALRARSLGLVFNAALGLALSAVFLFASRPILSALSTAEGIIEDTANYMSVVGGSCVIMALTKVFTTHLRAFGKARLTLIATVAGNVTNVALNALFIYLGYGVWGVAAATATANLVTLLLALVFSVRLKIKADKCDVPDGKLFASIVKIGLPSAGELIIFYLAISFEVMCLNRMDAKGVAIGVFSYCNQICNVIYCAAVGLGQANGVIAGWRVGEGRFDECYRQTMRAVKIGILLTGGIGILCAIIARPFIALLTDDAAILGCVTGVMWINVVKEFGRAGNVALGTTLKATGDAAATVLMGVVAMPICALLGGYVLGLKFGLGVYGAFIGMALDEGSRCVMMYIRFRSRKWESKAVVTKSKA